MLWQICKAICCICSAMQETMHCPSRRLVAKVKNLQDKFRGNFMEDPSRLQLVSTLHVNSEPVIFQVNLSYSHSFHYISSPFLHSTFFMILSVVVRLSSWFSQLQNIFTSHSVQMTAVWKQVRSKPFLVLNHIFFKLFHVSNNNHHIHYCHNHHQ